MSKTFKDDKGREYEEVCRWKGDQITLGNASGNIFEVSPGDIVIRRKPEDAATIRATIDDYHFRILSVPNRETLRLCLDAYRDAIIREAKDD